MKKLALAVFVCVAMLTICSAQVRDPVSPIPTTVGSADGLVRSLVVANLGALQPATVFVYEYTDLGNSRLQTDIKIGSRDANGIFVEQSTIRLTFTADAATLANWTKVQASPKNRLATLAASLP